MKTTLALSALLTVLSLGCGAAAESDLDLATVKANGPLSCTIQTYNGRYLTAVGGSGRVSDVLHTDATVPNAWERFTLVDSNAGTPVIQYGIKTKTGHYLTAVGGGGRITDVIHSNATQLLAWEKFQLNSLGGGWYSIQTVGGRYLTAVNAGGMISDAIHSDATQVLAWEKFFVKCQSL
jgi:hypothetical protein